MNYIKSSLKIFAFMKTLLLRIKKYKFFIFITYLSSEKGRVNGKKKKITRKI